MFDIKQYTKVNTVKEAIACLVENPGAKMISGGTDVLIRLRDGYEGFSELIDIHNMPELQGIKKLDNGDIRIGAGECFTHIIESDIVLNNVDVLGLASGTIGGPQVRNIATIGGNLCNGAISADSVASLCVLDTILEIEGANGVREVPVTEFYLGPGKIVLEHTEVLKSLLIKKENYENYGTHYYKYAMRNAMDIATIGCAVACKLDGDVIDSLKVTFTVAAPKPTRAVTAEKFAKGKKVTKESIDEIVALMTEDLNPRNSWRASKEFRLHIIKTLAKRVITHAINDAGGQL